jgi:hypothetical protein
LLREFVLCSTGLGQNDEIRLVSATELWELVSRNSSLNEATSTDQIKGAPLPKMINVKAVYLKSMAAEGKIYVRGERITPRTITQQLLEQYEEEDATGEAVVAFGSVGKRHLGWIGDVNFSPF